MNKKEEFVDKVLTGIKKDLGDCPGSLCARVIKRMEDSGVFNKEEIVAFINEMDWQISQNIDRSQASAPAGFLQRERWLKSKVTAFLSEHFCEAPKTEMARREFGRTILGAVAGVAAGAVAGEAIVALSQGKTSVTGKRLNIDATTAEFGGVLGYYLGKESTGYKLSAPMVVHYDRLLKNVINDLNKKPGMSK